MLTAKWLPGHRWVAELDGEVVGWTAISPVSSREVYAGVGESSVYVAESARGRGVGKALLWRQVNEADAAGLWTLQTSVFPENRASIALHHSAGYETLAVRSRIAQLDGEWRDTVLLERRRAGDRGCLRPLARHCFWSRSSSRSRSTRDLMSSRMGRTASMPCPAGSSSSQSS